MINLRLATQKNLSKEQIEKIEFRQFFRGVIEEVMQSEVIASTKSITSSNSFLENLYHVWQDNEHRLQNLWGFTADWKYHKFWTVPGCTCPKLDNQDNYPTGPYFYNDGCPYHKIPF